MVLYMYLRMYIVGINKGVLALHTYPSLELSQQQLH